MSHAYTTYDGFSRPNSFKKPNCNAVLEGEEVNAGRDGAKAFAATMRRTKERIVRVMVVAVDVLVLRVTEMKSEKSGIASQSAQEQNPKNRCYH
jgi:hypothetical protein